MNLLRITLVAVNLCGLILLIPAACIASEEIEDHILDAYTSDPAVAEAINQYLERGYVEGSLRSVGLSSLCGVAGCGYSVLIVHSFGSTGSNPRTSSIIALIRVNPFGEVSSVELMDLKPAMKRIEIGGKIPPPAPRIRAGERIPAPARKLRIKDKIPAPHPVLQAEPYEPSR